MDSGYTIERQIIGNKGSFSSLYVFNAMKDTSLNARQGNAARQNGE